MIQRATMLVLPSMTTCIAFTSVCPQLQLQPVAVEMMMTILVSPWAWGLALASLSSCSLLAMRSRSATSKEPSKGAVIGWVRRNRAIAIANFHRRPEIAAISNTLRDKGTLRFKGANLHRQRRRFASANAWVCWGHWCPCEQCRIAALMGPISRFSVTLGGETSRLMQVRDTQRC